MGHKQFKGHMLKTVDDYVAITTQGLHEIQN